MHINSSPFTTNSLSDNNIRSILEDKHGNVWVGTTEGGLEKYEPSTGKFTHFKAFERLKKGLSGNRVMAILENNDGTFWIGTNLGLDHFDPVTNVFINYSHDAGNSSSLSNDQVVSLLLTTKEVCG